MLIHIIKMDRKVQTATINCHSDYSPISCLTSLAVLHKKSQKITTQHFIRKYDMDVR